MFDTLARELQAQIALLVDDCTTTGRLAQTKQLMKELLHERLGKLREQFNKRQEARRKNAEQMWQALAQTGVSFDLSNFSQNKSSCRIQLVYRDGTEFMLQTHDACSTHWDRYFYVFDARNKKEAMLQAKIYVLENVATMRLVGKQECVSLRTIMR